jgi:pimeloyl-ACP methyl ester carboxylesterase
MPDAAACPEPFMPETAPAALEDLGARLRATRWPDSPEDAGWSLGTDLAYLRRLVDYWADEFDWPAQEAALAQFPHFRVLLGGLRIHFVHVRATASAGSVLPLDSIAVAGLWAQLMSVLGYQRFGAAGGDIGSHVSRYLALDRPERVVAVHRTDAGLPVFAGEPADLAPEERAWIEAGAAWAAAEGAYAAMHRPKPQTAAFGLTDSPAGLAAWIVEKLRAWSDCDGNVERSFTKDEILTNVTLYWLTGTIGSSMRMYHANAAIPPAQLGRRVGVPSGFSLFPGDIVRPPRAWLERTANVVRVTEPRRGGHFAPFEEPELYAEELRVFFRPYRAAAVS